MAAVLLDTTVLIDVLRGRPAGDRLRRLRELGDTPCTSGVNVEELYRGLRTPEADEAGQLLDGLRIVSLGRNEGVRAGTWRRHYASRGRTLSQADCLVAAAAAAVGGRLATGNPKDFPMSELAVDHWPVGT